MDVTDAERALCARIQRMLCRFEYLLPLAAADYQYRRHYYRLNAAALLEDLFYDALGTHLRQTEPLVRFGRAPSGAKAWDYEIDGLKASHKMSKVGSEISVHWDATVKRETWSAEHPMVVGLSANLPNNLIFRSDTGQPIKARPLRRDDSDSSAAGKHQTVLIGSWDRSEAILSFVVRDTVAIDPTKAFKTVVPFSRIWAHLADHLAQGRRCNDFDVLVGTPNSNAAVLGEMLRIEGDALLPGFHVFPVGAMQGIPLSSNNRSGSLLSRDFVRTSMALCQTEGLFAPQPLWFSMYAEDRPPNLYSVQRQELDGLFSARLD